MKIGIIIHSHTGNTLYVAEKIKDALITKGHEVQLERVTAENEDPPSKEKVILKSIPDILPYDALIIGAPVRAFSLSPVMKAYLVQVSKIQGKRVDCFVTEHFAKPWMGGNHAVKLIIQAIKKKGGEVIEKGIINWSDNTREEQINELVSRLSSI
jgi:flavodoxin